MPDPGEVTSASDAAAPLAVEMSGICKAFYGQAANRDVDLAVRRGEVHALLGENGAGKSTLCSVLAGLYQPDAGRIAINGTPCSFGSPHDALRAGVGMVYQHYRLVHELTVAENLALAAPDLGYRLSRRGLERRARETMERFGMTVHPQAYVGDLSVGEQQRVEILKLLALEVDVLALDEPTAVLTPQETEVLFTAIRAMADAGKAVIFVSHKLREVLAVCDRATVLRHGELIGTVDALSASEPELARMMVGEAAAEVQAPPRRAKATRQSTSENAVLTVRGLNVKDDNGRLAVNGVDLSVAAGELLGVAGVAGNGQRELAEAIAGMRVAAGGQVRIGGADVTALGAYDRAVRGLGFVPEDRLGTGVASGLPLEDNLILRGYRRPPLSTGPFLRSRAIAAEVKQRVAEFDIRGIRPGLPTSTLSGGNVQRVILARELSQQPRVLIAASPTRGLDVGATAVVQQFLCGQCADGGCVLLMSEDLDELLGLCDRLIILYEGRVVGEVTPPSDREQIGLLMAGAEMDS
jgi:simple sugar transport system ATP-binding protein